MLADHLFRFGSQQGTLVESGKEEESDAVGHADPLHHELCTAGLQTEELQLVGSREQGLHGLLVQLALPGVDVVENETKRESVDAVKIERRKREVCGVTDAVVRGI